MAVHCVLCAICSVHSALCYILSACVLFSVLCPLIGSVCTFSCVGYAQRRVAPPIRRTTLCIFNTEADGHYTAVAAADFVDVVAFVYIPAPPSSFVLSGWVWPLCPPLCCFQMKTYSCSLKGTTHHTRGMKMRLAPALFHEVQRSVDIFE